MNGLGGTGHDGEGGVPSLIKKKKKKTKKKNKQQLERGREKLKIWCRNGRNCRNIPWKVGPSEDRIEKKSLRWVLAFEILAAGHFPWGNVRGGVGRAH